MQKFKSYILGAGIIIACYGISSCKKNFAEINTNPSVVTTPDIKYLLTYAEDRIVTYQGTEWVWESMEQLFRFTQHMTTDPYEMTNNVNSRYGTYYLQILPNLFEIRRQIAAKPDKDNYKKMDAVTYVLQVLHGIKVTDMNGSIPYSQAVQGRYEGNFNPVYDKQEDLFTQWLQELDNAIAILGDSNLPNQNTYGTSDVFYKGDFTKWTKLANSLKLRIAARLDVANNAKAREIFQQVMQNATGPIETDDAQLSYQNVDYFPFGTGGDINYRSTRFATTSIIKFLKTANDPRLPVYFEPNELQGSYPDTLAKYGASLPAFITPGDPLIRYQGGPADFTTNPSVATYIKNAFAVGNTNAGNSISRYFLISPANRKFFSPRYNSTSGEFRDVVVTAAESCLLIAEFIQKGYAGSVNTRGTAEDWYKKGITSSIITMNEIAKAAGSATIAGDVSAAITAYLNDPAVKFNGVNDLERIYIQEYLNFYRNANEAFVFIRRTGYPKKVSTYYAREPFNETIPRRFWTIDPGEVNRSNWNAAMQEQGFTPNAQDLPTLSTQRIWYDKTSPNFGEGN
ncbi:MAG TPA: SusD/RagB family nutrient-binding outer membrane lipoprotein [Chitinophagaceae bacterium]|nr:SusD/RagB family nutrient-binding outer membrane lipoprotein [Chitinophagaceae bacterium]